MNTKCFFGFHKWLYSDEDHRKCLCCGRTQRFFCDYMIQEWI